MLNILCVIIIIIIKLQIKPTFLSSGYELGMDCFFGNVFVYCAAVGDISQFFDTILVNYLK